MAKAKKSENSGWMSICNVHPSTNCWEKSFLPASENPFGHSPLSFYFFLLKKKNLLAIPNPSFFSFFNHFLLSFLSTISLFTFFVLMNFSHFPFSFYKTLDLMTWWSFWCICNIYEPFRCFWGKFIYKNTTARVLR